MPPHTRLSANQQRWRTTAQISATVIGPLALDLVIFQDRTSLIHTPTTVHCKSAAAWPSRPLRPPSRCPSSCYHVSAGRRQHLSRPRPRPLGQSPEITRRSHGSRAHPRRRFSRCHRRGLDPRREGRARFSERPRSTRRRLGSASTTLTRSSLSSGCRARASPRTSRSP